MFKLASFVALLLLRAIHSGGDQVCEGNVRIQLRLRERSREQETRQPDRLAGDSQRFLGIFHPFSSSRAA
jgi:hypothetical protein